MGALSAQREGGWILGTTNLPTATLLPGEFLEHLDDNGLGFARELEMLVAAREASLVSIAYTHSLQDAAA